MLKKFYIRDEAAREVQKDLNENITATFKRNQRVLRFIGLGQGLGIQNASEADTTSVGNTRAKIALQCSHPADVRILQQTMGLPDELAQRIPHLNKSKGEAIISIPGNIEPCLIYIPLVAHAGYASQADLAARQAAALAQIESEIIRAPKTKDSQESYAYLEMLGERIVEEPKPPEVPASEIQKKFFDDHHALLLKIQKHPGLPTAEQYRGLKWGSGRGTRIKEDLLAWGLIRCERKIVQNAPARGGRPAEIMIITPKGELFTNEQ
jgi:hypothetical protein